MQSFLDQRLVSPALDRQQAHARPLNKGPRLLSKLTAEIGRVEYYLLALVEEGRCLPQHLGIRAGRGVSQARSYHF